MGTKYAPFNNISIKLRGADLLTEEKHKLFHRKEHFSKVLFQSLQCFRRRILQREKLRNDTYYSHDPSKIIQILHV